MKRTWSSRRHKWDGAFISRAVDGGMAVCVKCGLIKRYVKGIPTYFQNDTVHDKKAPPCKAQAVAPSSPLLTNLKEKTMELPEEVKAGTATFGLTPANLAVIKDKTEAFEGALYSYHQWKRIGEIIGWDALTAALFYLQKLALATRPKSVASVEPGELPEEVKAAIKEVLFDLMDNTWSHAFEDESVPSTPTREMLLEKTKVFSSLQWILSPGFANLHDPMPKESDYETAGADASGEVYDMLDREGYNAAMEAWQERQVARIALATRSDNSITGEEQEELELPSELEIREATKALWDNWSRDRKGYLGWLSIDLVNGYKKGWTDCASIAQSTEASLKARIEELEAENEKLRETAGDVIEQGFDRYRDGRKSLTIEGHDGEKCWIVPFDAFENLRAALSK